MPEIGLPVCGSRSGPWLDGRASFRKKQRPCSPAASDWVTLESEWPRTQRLWINTLEVDDRAELSRRLAESREALRSVRETADFWRHCLGKQALGVVASALGLSSGEVLEQSVVKAWGRDVALPWDVLTLREYLTSR